MPIPRVPDVSYPSASGSAADHLALCLLEPPYGLDVDQSRGSNKTCSRYDDACVPVQGRDHRRGRFESDGRKLYRWVAFLLSTFSL